MIKIPGDLKPGIFILQKGMCCEHGKEIDQEAAVVC